MDQYLHQSKSKYEEDNNLLRMAHLEGPNNRRRYGNHYDIGQDVGRCNDVPEGNLGTD
jgi:hypothetical protein